MKKKKKRKKQTGPKLQQQVTVKILEQFAAKETYFSEVERKCKTEIAALKKKKEKNQSG